MSRFYRPTIGALGGIAINYKSNIPFHDLMNSVVTNNLPGKCWPEFLGVKFQGV